MFCCWVLGYFFRYSACLQVPLCLNLTNQVRYVTGIWYIVQLVHWFCSVHRLSIWFSILKLTTTTCISCSLVKLCYRCISLVLLLETQHIPLHIGYENMIFLMGYEPHRQLYFDLKRWKGTIINQSSLILSDTQQFQSCQYRLCTKVNIQPKCFKNISLGLVEVDI